MEDYEFSNPDVADKLLTEVEQHLEVDELSEVKMELLESAIQTGEENIIKTAESYQAYLGEGSDEFLKDQLEAYWDEVRRITEELGINTAESAEYDSEWIYGIIQDILDEFKTPNPELEALEQEVYKQLSINDPEEFFMRSESIMYKSFGPELILQAAEKEPLLASIHIGLYENFPNWEDFYSIEVAIISGIANGKYSFEEKFEAYSNIILSTGNIEPIFVFEDDPELKRELARTVFESEYSKPIKLADIEGIIELGLLEDFVKNKAVKFRLSEGLYAKVINNIDEEHRALFRERVFNDKSIGILDRIQCVSEESDEELMKEKLSELLEENEQIVLFRYKSFEHVPVLKEMLLDWVFAHPLTEIPTAYLQKELSKASVDKIGGSLVFMQNGGALNPKEYAEVLEAQEYMDDYRKMLYAYAYITTTNGKTGLPDEYASSLRKEPAFKDSIYGFDLGDFHIEKGIYEKSKAAIYVIRNLHEAGIKATRENIKAAYKELLAQREKWGEVALFEGKNVLMLSHSEQVDGDFRFGKAKVKVRIMGDQHYRGVVESIRGDRYSLDELSRRKAEFEQKFSTMKSPMTFLFHGHGGSPKKGKDTAIYLSDGDFIGNDPYKLANIKESENTVKITSSEFAELLIKRSQAHDIEQDIIILSACFSNNFVREVNAKLRESGKASPMFITGAERNQSSYSDFESKYGASFFESTIFKEEGPVKVKHIWQHEDGTDRSNPSLFVPTEDGKLYQLSALEKSGDGSLPA